MNTDCFASVALVSVLIGVNFLSKLPPLATTCRVRVAFYAAVVKTHVSKVTVAPLTPL